MNTEEHYQKSHNCNDEEHFSKTQTPVGSGNPALTSGTGATTGQIPTGTGSGTGTGYNNPGTGGYDNAGTGGYNNAGTGTGTGGYTGNAPTSGYNNAGNTGTGTGTGTVPKQSTGQKIASAIPGTQANKEKKAMQNQY